MDSPDDRTLRRTPAKSTLRNQWWIILVPALIAAVIGFLASRGSSYSAQALASVSAPAGGNAQDFAAVAAAASNDAQTDGVYVLAAHRLGIPVADLHKSVTVGLNDKDNSITFTGTGKGAAEAAQRANAVVRAAVDVSEQRVQAKVRNITDDTEQALKSQQLQDAAAEKARVQQLGTSLGQAQSDALSSSAGLTLLESATSTDASKSPMLPITLGSMIGGALLGLAVLLFMNSRRGRGR